VKQVVQPAGGGPVKVLDVPRPVISPTEVLVRTLVSVISPGTERAVTAFARSSLLAKARARPDLVRQAVCKAQAEGIPAAARAIRGRLATDVPLGYSAAGLVTEVGAAVDGIGVGQLVATGGAGKANHAEFQAVPGLLCAVVPEAVPPEDAAFATLASIPLHALRLSEAGPGSKIVVLGLGLVGQLAARLAIAAGCDVAGIDPDGFARETAGSAGVLALDESGDATTDQVLSWSRGRGADVVLVCAADRSPRPMSRAPALCRDRAAVVMVGDVGMPPHRAPFYEREISLLFARSYGPGPVVRHRRRGRGLPAPGGADRALPGDPPHLSGRVRPGSAGPSAAQPGRPYPARDRLDRRGCLFHRDAAARLPRRWL
jgi:NADPH:quinone reductase-like Zn-dependent oxidoreductase